MRTGSKGTYPQCPTFHQQSSSLSGLCGSLKQMGRHEFWLAPACSVCLYLLPAPSSKHTVPPPPLAALFPSVNWTRHAQKDRHALFRENRESTRPPLLIEIPFREPAADLFLIFGPRTTAGRQDHLRIPDIHLQSDNSAFCRIPYRYSILYTLYSVLRTLYSVLTVNSAGGSFLLRIPTSHFCTGLPILLFSVSLLSSLGLSPPAPEPPLSDSGLDPL